MEAYRKRIGQAYVTVLRLGVSEKRYGTKSEKQKAYRERKKNLSGGASNSEASAGKKNQNEVEPASPPAQPILPVPVLAEPQKKVREIDNEAVSEARESTIIETPTRGTREEARGWQTPPYDKKKYPNRGAWEIAVQRVERAVRYAQMFPNLISSDDRKFQTLDWQYQNEGLKAPTS